MHDAASSRARPASGRLPAVPLRRAWNIPWIVVGVLLVAGSSLAFVVVGAPGGAAGTAAVALARDVRAGEALTAADLRVVRVSGTAVAAVRADDRADLVGQVALVDLPAGSVLNRGVLAARSPVASGRALVGISLDLSAAPISGLRPGDAVMVVRTPDPADGIAAPEDAVVTVWKARVFAVTPVKVPTGEVLTASLEVDALDAPAVAAAAAADRVRLALVRSLDDIPPELLFADALTVGGVETTADAGAS